MRTISRQRVVRDGDEDQRDGDAEGGEDDLRSGAHGRPFGPRSHKSTRSPNRLPASQSEARPVGGPFAPVFLLSRNGWRPASTTRTGSAPIHDAARVEIAKVGDENRLIPEVQVEGMATPGAVTTSPSVCANAAFGSGTRKFPSEGS